ncbi:hypothetical protein FOFC_20955, partial [Fusarium oxysporum]
MKAEIGQAFLRSRAGKLVRSWGWTMLVRPEQSRHQRKETISLWHGTERSAAEACSGPYLPVTKVQSEGNGTQ